MKTVLIETYWNVNTVAGGVDYAASVVLIETYWNVNPQLYQGWLPP